MKRPTKHLVHYMFESQLPMLAWPACLWGISSLDKRACRADDDDVVTCLACIERRDALARDYDHLLQRLIKVSIP